MMRPLSISLLLCSVALPAWALSDPSVSAKDNMDRTVVYDPHNRVPLVIQQGGLVVITFDTAETIEQVVKVDSAPFSYPCEAASGSDKQQCDAGYTNNLPLVGKTAGSADLVVLTRGQAPDDKERSYIFAVKVVSGDDPAITKHLTFSYGAQDHLAPAPPKSTPAATALTASSDGVSPPPRPLTWKEKKAQEEAAIYTARMEADVSFGPQNTRYVAQGKDRNIGPIGAADNGLLTGFRYPGTLAPPSVFKVIDGIQGVPAACVGGRPSAGELEAPEQAVNTRMVNDVLTVHDTAQHWRLRMGEAVVDVWNCAYNPVAAVKPDTGTDSPDLVRRVIRR